jgi:hypothetical protein
MHSGAAGSFFLKSFESDQLIFFARDQMIAETAKVMHQVQFEVVVKPPGRYLSKGT